MCARLNEQLVEDMGVTSQNHLKSISEARGILAAADQSAIVALAVRSGDCSSQFARVAKCARLHAPGRGEQLALDSIEMEQCGRR